MEVVRSREAVKPPAALHILLHCSAVQRLAEVMPSFSSEGITVPSRRKQRGTSFGLDIRCEENRQLTKQVSMGIGAL